MQPVELKNVSKQYGNFTAVDRLSFTIAPGAIYGLLGPNGAGKTSTIRMMIGITVPDTGEVRMFGEPFRREHLQRIGYLPEERGLYKKMKILDQIVFMAELHGVSAADARRRGLAWCERLQIADWAMKKAEELSKGMQQKIQFITALLHDPEFIIMDEPFAGLDPVNSTLLKDVLLDLKKQGRTILFSTHRMDQVEKLCDDICLVNHGKSVLQGTMRDIKASFGRNTVQIDYEGDGTFLERAGDLVQSSNNYGNSAEIHLKPGADAQQLLRLAAQSARISRFEIMEPSLEEIFIATVGPAEEMAQTAAK
jgi:ABC-2 type transport system ATP-binding protein